MPSGPGEELPRDLMTERRRRELKEKEEGEGGGGLGKTWRRRLLRAMVE